MNFCGEADCIVVTSCYAKVFDSSSVEWTRDPEYNITFLYAIEKYINRRLKEKGYVYLNEVYDSLDLKLTVSGQSVGWIYDKDKQVEFTIYQIHNTMLIDFNVDGEITKELVKRKIFLDE